MQRPTLENTRIRNAEDAFKVMFAAIRGELPMVTRRLNEPEREALCSGCVYVWEKDKNASPNTPRLERFTEGRKWGPSRIRDSFLFYYERSPPRLSSTGPEWDQLIKQTYSVETGSGASARKWHLNAYFSYATMDQLRTVDDAPPLRALRVPPGTFRERARVRKRRADAPAPASASASAPAHVYAPFSALAARGGGGAPAPAAPPGADRRGSVDSLGTSESASERSSSEEPPSPAPRAHPHPYAAAYFGAGPARAPPQHDAWRAHAPRTAALPAPPFVRAGSGGGGGGWPGLHLPPIDTLQEARPWAQRDVQDEMLLRALDRRTVM